MAVRERAALRPKPKPAAASEPGEQHSLLRSIVLHLAPGVALTLFVVAAAPLVTDWGFPALFAFFVGIALVIVPLELGYLLWAGRGGRPVVDYRERPAVRAYALVVPLALWFIVVLALSIALVDERLADSLFGWFPESIRQFSTFEDDEPLAGWRLAVLLVVAFVFNGFVGPVVEELYFRGHLLPRIDRFGRGAPVLNTVLFSVYHLWTPWQNPGRIVAALPWIYIVWRRRSVRLSIAVHVAINVTFLLLVLAVFL